MNDDVLAVAISPDAKHIAVALLDSTVKVCIFNLSKLQFVKICHIITLVALFLYWAIPTSFPEFLLLFFRFSMWIH